MTKATFNTHLLNGTAYEYHTKRIRRNDIRWFITLIVSIIAVVFMMENREPVVIDNSKEVKASKILLIRVCMWRDLKTNINN